MQHIIHKLKTSNATLLVVLVGIAFVMTTLVFTTETYKRPDFVRYDMTGYYAYLPALFIHHDLSLTFNESLDSDYFKWCALVEDGKVFRTTMGVSIMLLPFYGLGELITWIGNFERTGFTSVYFFCLAFAPIFYLILGLWFILQTLKLYVSTFSITLTIVTLAFATNVFYYVLYEGIMSHIYSFSLYAVFLYATVMWHRKPSMLLAVLVGFSYGMLVLIRPIHTVAALFFLFYDIPNLKLKYQYFYHIFIIGTVSFLCVVPQLIYWKCFAGQWIFYTYGEEGFFLLDSKFTNGLLSFRNGWLVYTPVMVFSLIGIFFLHRAWKSVFWSVLVFSVLYIYVVFSWWCWWYGGSFGSRSMVDVYAVFAIPLAVFIHKMSNTFSGKVAIVTVVVLLSFFNLFQTWQYNHGLIHFDGMNKKLYLRTFGETVFPNDFEKLLTHPNYNDAIKGKRDE